MIQLVADCWNPSGAFALEKRFIGLMRRYSFSVHAPPYQTLDGIGKYYAETIEQSEAEPVDVVVGTKHHGQLPLAVVITRLVGRQPGSQLGEQRRRPADDDDGQGQAVAIEPVGRPRRSERPAAGSSPARSHARWPATPG